MRTFALLIAIAASACNAPTEPKSPPAPAASATTSVDEKLPPDGKPLFSFLLQRIPDLAMKVPCSCCQFRIGQCYQGACPSNCVPCNQIGRDVYAWHQQGLGDDEILTRVAAKYPHR